MIWKFTYTYIFSDEPNPSLNSVRPNYFVKSNYCIPDKNAKKRNVHVQSGTLYGVYKCIVRNSHNRDGCASIFNELLNMYCVDLRHLWSSESRYNLPGSAGIYQWSHDNEIRNRTRNRWNNIFLLGF